MAKIVLSPVKRRQFTEEVRREAVQMIFDGLTATAVAQRLGLGDPILL